jgi:cyclopropane fatty-acyl-phospholipid synthase-like methyltransferase
MTRAVPDPDEWWTQYRADYASRSWRDYRHLLAEALRHAPGPPLLDVGSGYGFLVECARQFGVPAIGLEASERAVDECRRRHPLADVRLWSSGTPLPCDDASIGAAMLNQVIDHMTLEHNRLLFAELRRVLKPEGAVIVHSPSRFNSFDTDTGHVTFFSPSEFRAFVIAAGFRIIEQPYVPQPVLGTGVGWLLVRALARVYKPERLAATIDLVAIKP